MRILILNGPNLNLLGIREPEIYGYDSLESILADIRNRYPEHEILHLQTNREDELIERLQKTLDEDLDGIVINPAAWSHYSIAVLDALRMVKVPKVEVHISFIYRREAYRQSSLTAQGCDAMMTGLGTSAYRLAVQWLVDQKVK